MSISSSSKDHSQTVDGSPSTHSARKSDSESSSDAFSVASANGISETGETPDRINQSDVSYNQRKDLDVQSPAYVRSEECRQLFHLPPEEVLVRDFNCALQENILLQGHMYLFIHHICFYSNIFGYETRKIIPLHEVTCVRKAKTVAIFPNAIEILAGEKKHFFTSFLSRDEAYRLIVDGWSQHNSRDEALVDDQEPKSETGNQDNTLVLLERNNEAYTLESNKLATDCEDESTLPVKISEVQNSQGVVDSLSHGECMTWMIEDIDSPKVPEYYTMVAESKFQLRLEDFFILFFSDDAIDFVETFHRRCKDKDFQCTRWDKHEQFGQVRDVSFQHPIKIYLGAKFGQCRELQKFRVYRNKNLVIETSQQINDVPYGDYFRVEGLWDVQQEGNAENVWCILKVYVNLSFSRKTMWKGKIEQSTVEECKEAYAIWINCAYDLLKQKQNPATTGGASQVLNSVQCGEVELNCSTELKPPSMRKRTIRRISERKSDSNGMVSESNHPVTLPLPESANNTSITIFFEQVWAAILTHLKGRSSISVIVAIAFISILILTQLSIIILLTREPQLRMVSQEAFAQDFATERTEAVAWLEKRVSFLKDEMLIMESRLEKMHSEYLRLKTYMHGLEKPKRRS